jgi:hypothetical protein
VFWCLGLDRDQPVLKLVNNRRYALEAHHGSAAVLNPGLLDNIDPTVATIEPRDELRLQPTLAPGGLLRISTEYDGLADSVHTLKVALEALAAILGRGPDPHLAEIADHAGLAGGCLFNLGKADDPPDPAAIAFACLDKDHLAQYFNAPAALLLAPVALGGELIDYLHSRLNYLGDLTNGRAQYTITITRTATPGPTPPGLTPSESTPSPPCLSASQARSAYTSQLQPGQSAQSVSAVRCAGAWAVAQVNVAEADTSSGGAPVDDSNAARNAYTGIFHWSAGTWNSVNPSNACPGTQIPAAIRSLACNSN